MDFDLTLFETAGGAARPMDSRSTSAPFRRTPTDYGPVKKAGADSNGLVIAFDTWDNGGEPPAIEAKADGGRPAQRRPQPQSLPAGIILNLFDNVSPPHDHPLGRQRTRYHLRRSDR